jgi:EmrB/QacA subfamily drug resistance transporter
MRHTNKNLVLVAMIFAVGMIFIDQTIVALAIPKLQHDLHLSSTGSQWIVNGYLLALSALFAFGGKLSDVVGHRRMVIGGVALFAAASALCGATPTGSIGEAWMIFFRIVQGAAAAFLFPSALAIVVSAYPLRERGKALAIFFSASGGLTAIGPIAGGYLTEWTWRSIFWINVPIALIAIVLTAMARASIPELPKEQRPRSIDGRGAVLVSGGMGLLVLGLQQASVWGWSDVKTWGSIVLGVVLLAAFVAYELRVPNRLVQLRIFQSRAFAVDNIVLFLLSVCFVPLFFFASLYAQIALGESATNAGLFLLVFFGGFSIAAQRGGRILDSQGARPSVVLGCAVAAVGFYLWGSQVTDLSFDNQWYYIAIAGAGVGLVLGPVSTDALNRAPRDAYGEVTGITQTVRNFGASLGLAILGTILLTQNTSRIEKTLGSVGVPTREADRLAQSLSGAGGSGGGSFGGQTGARARQLFDQVQLDFAHSTRIVLFVMAGVMAAAFVVALVALPAGRVEEPVLAEEEPASDADAVASG